MIFRASAHVCLFNANCSRYRQIASGASKFSLEVAPEFANISEKFHEVTEI